MEKMIITNNPQAESYAGKIKVAYLENKSTLAVLKEGLKVAQEGGQLLVDPNKNNPAKAYYKSLPFYKNGATGPDQRSMDLLKSALSQVEKTGMGEEAGKEPLLVGLQQKKDMEVLSKVLG